MKKSSAQTKNIEDRRVTPLQKRMAYSTADRQAATKSDRRGGVAEMVASPGFDSKQRGSLYKTGKIRQALEAAGKPSFSGAYAKQLQGMHDMLQKNSPK